MQGSSPGALSCCLPHTFWNPISNPHVTDLRGAAAEPAGPLPQMATSHQFPPGVPPWVQVIRRLNLHRQQEWRRDVAEFYLRTSLGLRAQARRGGLQPPAGQRCLLFFMWDNSSVKHPEPREGLFPKGSNQQKQAHFLFPLGVAKPHWQWQSCATSLGKCKPARSSPCTGHQLHRGARGGQQCLRSLGHVEEGATPGKAGGKQLNLGGVVTDASQRQRRHLTVENRAQKWARGRERKKGGTHDLLWPVYHPRPARRQRPGECLDSRISSSHPGPGSQSPATEKEKLGLI